MHGSLLIFSANCKLRKRGLRGTEWGNQKQMVTSRRQQPPRTETCILPELCASWSQFPTYLRLKMVAMLVVDLVMSSLLIFSLLSSPWWRWWPCRTWWWSSNLFWTFRLSSHSLCPSLRPRFPSDHARSCCLYPFFRKASRFTTLSLLSWFLGFKVCSRVSSMIFHLTLSKSKI